MAPQTEGAALPAAEGSADATVAEGNAYTLSSADDSFSNPLHRAARCDYQASACDVPPGRCMSRSDTVTLLRVDAVHDSVTP